MTRVGDVEVDINATAYIGSSWTQTRRRFETDARKIARRDS